MLTFLDHKGNETGALTTFKYTNSVNGERSLSGTVHGNLEIEKGWGVRFEDEYYKVIYAKPQSLGKINIVQFDAVHQFFWDFDKSSVYSELDGSYPFQTFLDHIFNGSGYRYNLEVEVGSLRKQNFGLKKRLELFNDLIKHAGVEFQVRGKVVRILERTGTDLSTVVRKKLNLNDLSIEKRIGDFITYQKGLGAWRDENDHSKGRLEVEYVSPLAAIYGRLEGEPYVDERFTIAKNFLEVLKKTVEDSYSISVQLTMEDLHKAGYRYTRPLAGDYITVIDEDINFKERVRIVSFETEYDIKGQVIDHTVTCNDIGSVKKQNAGYSSLKSSVANVSKETENAIQTANRALVSADGKSTVYFGTEFPQDVPKGTLAKGDTLYLKVGDKTKMYYWNGAEWLEPPVVNDVEAFKESINTEIAQVNQSMQSQAQEHDRQVAGILSKTQSVEALANQAKSEAASAIARANQVKAEAIADARAQVATVSQALNTAKTELQTAIANADQKARDSQASATALRNDLNMQASKILAQAQAQTALTNRVTTVETLADGTRSTVAELSKTVNKATGDIASVTSRTKSVEDTLSQTRTQYEALTQTVNAQTGQIDSINRKTADLQSGIDGVTERFENLQVGGENLLLNAGFEGATDSTATFTVGGVTYIAKRIPNWYDLYNSGVANPTTSYHAIYRESFEGKGPVIEFNESDGSRNWKAISAILDTKSLTVGGNYTFSADLYATGTGTKIWFGFYYYNKNGVRNFHSGQTTINISTINKWHRVAGQIKLNEDIDLSRGTNFYIYAYNFTTNSILYLTKPKLEIGTVATAFSLAQETIRSEIAEYKRTADQNYAGLQTTVSTLDGKVTQNKTEANQTATQLSNRLTSLETYKDGETTRAQAYFEATKTETAKQLTAERAVIANNYLAKSTYDEDARGTTLKLNEIKSTADTAKQNLATYQNTVDRKLEELTSSTQTLDGKINTASSKVDTVAGQIRTEISNVEGKIPIEIGVRNYILKSQAGISSTGRWVSKPFNLSSDLLSNLSKIKTVTISCDVEGRNVTAIDNRKRYGLAWSVEINGIVNYWEVWQTEDTAKKRISQTFTVPDGKVITKLHLPTLWIQAGGDIKVSNPKIEFGRVPTDHTLAPEDINDELSSVKTTINQTSQGVEQLSTSLSTTNDKVSTAETEINQLIGDVSSKVSQTDYNTLTGRVDSAETAITQNATEISKRLTKTEVDKAITDKGYQTKSDVDSNINGRGYITSSSLQPYALSTTVQNLVKETADSFRRTISETKALIPTFVGGRNYLLNSNVGISGVWSLKVISLSQELLNNLSKIKTVTISCEVVGENVSVYNSRKRFGLSWSVEIDGIVNYWEVWQTEDTAKKRISQTFTVPDGKVITKLYSPTLWIQAGGNITVSNPKLEYGTLATDYTVALEDLATVTALHDVSDTVDSHTRTIGAVGTAGSILDNVSKVTQTAAGLVQEVSGDNGLKTQVSTLAGSYAIKSLTKAGDVLGQINLNKDGSVKIDGSLVQITGKTYIENGVIKEAMIGKGQIGTAHIGEIDAGIAKIINLDVSNIKGLDAEFIKAKIENAFIGWMKGKTITAVNDATTFDLATGVITVNNNQSGIVFKDGNSVVGRIGYGNITQLGIGSNKGIDIYAAKNSTIALGYELSTGKRYSTAIQINGGTGNVIIPTSLRLTSGKLYPNFDGDEYLSIRGGSNGVSIGLGGSSVSISFTSDDIIFRTSTKVTTLSQLLSRG
ncbi:phage tail protein [Streptococcus suis]|uniref:phage tail protein n=1 Tax=Streptococcus suis TaxID=1307 RepID=UPI003757BDCA